MIEEEDEEKDILEDEETILRKKIEDMNKEIDKQQNLHNKNSVLRGQVRENILIT